MFYSNITYDLKNKDVLKNINSIGGSRGGGARRAHPHLPGILVFDHNLGHIGGTCFRVMISKFLKKLIMSKEKKHLFTPPKLYYVINFSILTTFLL